ncbi:MAG TPA: lysyl oxidase family protein [Actinomycetota bacterium]|nr:lysyl oxidase family protein [Actinomycetota bacterium]
MRARTRAAALAAALLLPLLASPAGAATPQPRIRLIAATPSVDAFTYGGGAVFLDLGTYLGVQDAPLRIDVRRADYASPITADVDLGGGQTVPVPPQLLGGWNGLRGMISIRVFSHGAQIRHRWVGFCPNGSDLERIDGAGPFAPTFPESCDGNPFSLGAVWGIDQGWAANALGYGVSMRLAKGTYRMEVAITPPFRSLLGIADADAQVSVRVHVKKGDGCVDLCPIASPGRSGASPRKAGLRAAADPAPDPATLPDLIALPAWGIEVDRVGSHDVLSFGATVWDAGPAPLIVEGYRVPGTDTMSAFEYFSSGGTIVGRAPVGTFLFDRRPGHDHWHFQQFARYRLLAADGTEVLRSKKEGFCLAPTDAIDLLVPGADWRPDVLGFSECAGASALWIRETLPTGWGDTYQQSLPGQAFDITSLPNGRYQIEIAANPTGELYEADTTNDAALRTVILRGTPGHRSVRVLPVGEITA